MKRRAKERSNDSRLRKRTEDQETAARKRKSKMLRRGVEHQI